MVLDRGGGRWAYCDEYCARIGPAQIAERKISRPCSKRRIGRGLKRVKVLVAPASCRRVLTFLALGKNRRQDACATVRAGAFSITERADCFYGRAVVVAVDA